MKNNVGRVLKYYREKNGITQRKISDALGLTTSQFISNCEKMKSPMPAALVRKICAVAKIPPSKLIQAALDDYSEKYKKLVRNSK